MNQEVSAVIVARKGSKRIKAKSLLELNGETLIARKIRQLKACKNIDRVIVGSDCEIMLNEALKCGAEAIRRPDYYCDEAVASANEMIKNMCSLITTDIVVWSHCTNPLISSKTYDAAVETYFANLPEYDSLLSVTELKEHLWKEEKAFNYNPYAERHTPAKELEPLFMQDGGIFIQAHKQMLDNSYFFGKKPYLFVIPQEEFLDINERKDYILAKAILDENQKFINK
ncbi:MAG: acylneuraminate cytidylyltransferase family protein [Candidatus Gastranaerophilales bacterium]|nr:acylneuraminate cytidylyltransferase family protein [Candidatus Gastranaerophilales bacterium]